MKITLRIKPNARRDEVREGPDGTYIVSVTASPIEGKANERLIEVLAQHFQCPKRNIAILRGHSARIKIVEIA